MARGRPAVTRARVLNYWRNHGPCPIMQVVRATGADRSYVKRILLQERTMEIHGKSLIIDDDVIRRFNEKIDKSPGQGPGGDCWIWIGARDSYNYARGIMVNGRMVRGTHLSLAIAGRERPSLDLIALHSCDNRPCVNPDHLRWGTDIDNAEDHRQRGRRGPHWLPDEVVHEIHRSNERNLDIARRLGMTPAAICNIRKGRAHKRIYDQYYPVT